MDHKNKNILIGGLLAIVLVMAVGYAAFATQLNINGTANIDTTWNVHFDTDKRTGSSMTDSTATDQDVTGVFAIDKKGSGQPTGALYYDDDLNAHLSATLKQPGDTEEFTLTIKNEGSFDATLSSLVMAWDSATTTAGATALAANARTATFGNIKWDITEDPATNLPHEGANATTTMKVTATYIAGNVTSSTGAQNSENPAITGNVTNASQSAGITITLVYKQA